MTIHPYNHNSNIYNILFHPLYDKKNKALSIITNIALTLLTGFLWQIPFWIINRLDHRKVEQWKASCGPGSTERADRTGRGSIGAARETNLTERDLKEVIQATPKHAEAVTTESLVKNYMSLFTHQHEIIDGVYLGDYRAFLSVDPEFLSKYSLVDSKEETIESLIRCGQTAQMSDPGQPAVSKRKAKNLYNTLAKDKGCSKLDIGFVISVTQFQPGVNVEDDNWARFQPDLESLGINRYRVPVDDDDFAWDEIKPHLEEIFEQIDLARSEDKKVLIHCVKGASRSATVMIAYLMHKYRVTYDEAFNFVKSKRTQIEAKPSLTDGLKAYQIELGIDI